MKLHIFFYKSSEFYQLLRVETVFINRDFVNKKAEGVAGEEFNQRLMATGHVRERPLFSYSSILSTEIKVSSEMTHHPWKPSLLEKHCIDTIKFLLHSSRDVGHTKYTHTISIKETRKCRAGKLVRGTQRETPGWMLTGMQ